MNLVENVDHYTSSCGYCSCGDSAAMGMWAHKLSCEAYQDLLDRGWRRSGQWVYRPLPEKQGACRCHPYTIRLDANKFEPSKDQRKVLRRFEAFLEGRRGKPRGFPMKQGTSEAGGCLSYAEPEAADSHGADGLSEQQWLADDRKRKSHLISPSPLASPAERHSLAEEASETLASPELTAILSAEFSSRAQSPMRGAARPAGAASAATKSIGVPVSREAAALPCSVCEGRHARGRCPEQASGCCTPVGSEESAHSAVATRLLDQEWPEQTVGPSGRALDRFDRSVEQSDHSQASARLVESALQEAVQQLILAGKLPSMQCPALLVRAPTQKRQKMSRSNVVLTSPAAHALAAAARRKQGGSSVSAISLAEALARQIAAAAGAAVLRDAAGCRLAAQAEAGHLNFLRQDSSAANKPEAPAEATSSLSDGEQPPRSYAEAAQLPSKGGRGQMMSSPLSSTPLDKSQHQTSQQPWRIPASYTGQHGCTTSLRGCSAQVDASVYMQTLGSGDSTREKQRHPAVDMDSSLEWTGLQSLQSQQLEATMVQQRSAAPREAEQTGAGRGSCPAAELRKLDIRTVPADSDLVAVEYPLYRKYQILHHREDPAEVTESTFRRFLVDSPLVPSSSAAGVRYGSFHQQYWVDGELIAVGVVDVLPRCLSSAYLFWDPDWASLGLGKLTALKEIAWVQAAAARSPALQWYHMGYFLETCRKMRYKADFHPSELLCMRTYAWVPLPIALPALKADSHCAIGLLDGHGDLAAASECEGSMRGGDALVYCGQPDGQRQLLRLAQLPDKVDGVAQELTVLLRAKLRVWQQLGGPTMTTFIVII